MPSQQSLADLHMHTFLSDGALLPSELVQRCIAAGYETMAITDHAGPSNIDMLIEKACEIAKEFNSRDHIPITVIPGIELTHVIPETIAELVARARSLGARIVVMHGETVVEPVPKGTNRAAIEAGVDILAHPGLITQEEVELARDRGVALEITTRKGHSTTNGHVARLAREIGAQMVLNSDTHSPADILSSSSRERTILGAGLGAEYLAELANNSQALADKLMGRA
jgi:histidinol phosphatase-like PHP family hydrolase